jgi:hypothetical protein
MFRDILKKPHRILIFSSGLLKAPIIYLKYKMREEVEKKSVFQPVKRKAFFNLQKAQRVLSLSI